MKPLTPFVRLAFAGLSAERVRLAALNNLGNAHAAANGVADAERSHRAALRLLPEYPGARRNLDPLLAGRGAGGQPAGPVRAAR